jgi:serine phosphatase RsbU (regulator of sigma subunit)
VAHIDSAKLKLADELRRYEPRQPDPDQGLGRVLRTGEALLFPEISADMLQNAAVDARHLGLLEAVGFRSAAIVPIRLGARVLGAMTLVTAESRRTLDRSDLELAEQVGFRSAVAIENARIYSERSRIAHTLQQSLLPETLPEVPGYELASAYIPAYTSTEVGGDFYDVWHARGHWMVAIGDVTGKGVEAAAVTALARYTLRATSEFLSSPAALLSHLNLALLKQRRPSICTAICACLDTNGVTIAIAGHPLPIRITSLAARETGEAGALLGAFDDAEWQDTQIPLAPGSTLVLFTDGVTDAVSHDGDRYGPERLHTTLTDCRDQTADTVIHKLTDALRSFQVGAHADDMAMLAIRRLTAVDESPVEEPAVARPTESAHASA